MRALVIEDDPKIAEFMRRGLEAEGHPTDVAFDGPSGLALAAAKRPDLVLLDLGLPGMDGLDLLRQLRAADVVTRVIAVTARGRTEDRVRGLDEGADDYVVKPFSFVELMARVRALFRRSSLPLERWIRVGDLELDRVERVARCGDKQVPVTGRELHLLEFFMNHEGEALTRAMISDRVWGYQFDTGTNVIDVYVNYLRRKLRQLGVEPIRTMRGVGYVFEASTENAADPTP